MATAIAILLLGSLASVLMNTLNANDDARERNIIAHDARFAMQRILQSVRDSQLLLVPLVEDPSTLYTESLIEPGLLAVTLNPLLDRDLNGIADADNDGDGLVDEDLPRDTSNDGKPGLIGIDDDNSSITDVSLAGNHDDDESGVLGDEDPINGLDDDGDGTVDEDPPGDMNGDGAPGVMLVDDDGDGLIDEGNIDDDDEDGFSDEDWLDAVVYFLSGTDLIERYPNLNPISGTDFTERIIANNVSTFRVERLPRGNNRLDLVEITLELTTSKAAISVAQRVRVGGPP